MEWRIKSPEGVAISCHKVTSDQWQLDSGCSHHMTGEKKNSSRFKEINDEQVKIGQSVYGKNNGIRMKNANGNRLDKLRTELGLCAPE